jgi:N-acetylmuramoyl-L-alanine amidase
LNSPLSRRAFSHRSDSWAREHFANAERLREALNGRPAADRTRRDYQRVLNAYRLVYRSAPTSTKADPSVVAVAETLVEMGRRFDDEKILHQAISEYKFLRREYPGSKYRCEALFTIGEVYQDDLNDRQSARAAFQEFLHRYLHSRLADDARQAIVALEQPMSPKSSEPRKLAGEESPGKVKTRETVDLVGDGQKRDDDSSKQGEPARKGELKESATPGVRPAHLPRVTSVRHWSTPDYSRVAIDLEGDINFSSQRIAHPARIYFDLPDTRLASTLVGKTFDVDDGFLKKIRVAQFAPRRARIVLEVDSLADYDAFLLPNPWRLIIDIHSKDSRAGQEKEDGASGHPSLSPENVIADQEIREPDDDSTDIHPAASANALSTPGVDITSAQANGHTPASMPSPSSGKSQTTVVKRIVEADDDDSESPATAAGRRKPTQTSASANSTERATDPEASASGPAPSDSGNLNGSQRRASSRLSSTQLTASDIDAHEARPTTAGDRSLIRALGLKIGKIVIDPGHGGHDTGTIGPNGLEEKDLVLDVGRRLGKLLESRLGSEVVFTRKDDTFIPLETRTAIANQARADLFVSIHANSSRDPAARGVETYYLNFTSSADALEVAARENAVSETSIYGLQDLVKKIALKEKIEESREFAWDVQESLHTGLAAKAPAIRDRGVKKAPFIVLIGANMPSILAEISFVSNPTDERRLSTAEYRQRIAESLYRGIAKYVNGLSGVKMASKLEKVERQ